LAFDRYGSTSAPSVLLMHGWPGDRTDYAAVAERLSDDYDVVVPDLRGFGESDKHAMDPAGHYDADAQVRSLVGLIDELGISQLVVGGYDVGSRVGQRLTALRPSLVRGLVAAPPLPGVGARILTPSAIRQFWYQSFHQLDLVEGLIDGRPDAVRAYLQYFWSHWSGDDFTVSAEKLDHLVSVYSPAGAFVASVGWYRAGAGAVARAQCEVPPPAAARIGTPTAILWAADDPVAPVEWSDRIDEYFADATTTVVDRSGHFLPVEVPELFAAAIVDVDDRTR